MHESNEEHSSLKERARKKLERDAGALIIDALNDPKTVELMCNADGKLWVERLGEPMKEIGQLRPAQAESIIKTVAGYHGKEVTRQNPLLEGEWPLDGSRFAGQLQPVVRAPTFAIRKKAVAIHTLDEYVEAEIMTADQCSVIKRVVQQHRNILIIGGTGSGKTTLVNAVINEIVVQFPAERVFIIEDIGEIQCAAANFVQYHTTLGVTMTELLRTTLRMRPDRILVGEVRGEEALDLLDAWNTGHPGGAATLHADSAVEGLTRLKSLVSRNRSAPSEIEPLIGKAVHVVVFIARTPKGRRIQEILEVSGYADGCYQLHNL
ncbi:MULTISPECIES: P-type conjugative transfer ATPase TrbB [Azotobacter]|uniref:Conjugal transfer ATPase TrbB n=1 Tax=Azotobacter chroococcum NCIMB 8003 TaxID=1328314 RepID=A0A0C4WS35_9GAMM|nr:MULTISPECIES: P-type conjugative transfer ATPase TrbB [Azotobacter]AJE23536.1 Conjugal transfer ATPase TrbB [Azotobacter chroococcum NCIMB 8003]MDV7210064.1 P-type conjugative transfer ATPase TrbB [Azotobacter beijerinckii]